MALVVFLSGGFTRCSYQNSVRGFFTIYPFVKVLFYSRYACYVAPHTPNYSVSSWVCVHVRVRVCDILWVWGGTFLQCDWLLSNHKPIALIMLT